MNRRQRLAVGAAIAVLGLVVYVGTTGTMSAFLARVTNTTNTVKSAYPSCVSFPLADNAQRFYALNESTGTVAYDQGPNNQTGTYQGGRNSTSQTPYACKRDNDWWANLDTTHWVSTPGTITLSPTTGSSHEAWFKTVNSQGVINGIGDTQVAASTKKDNLLLVNSNGKVCFVTFNGTTNYEAVSPISYNDGAWHHVVGVHDAAYGLRLYVDGAQVATAAGGHPENLTGYFRIGYDNTNGYTNGFGTNQPNAHFFGSMNYAAYYNYALTAAQVSNHYQAGK